MYGFSGGVILTVLIVRFVIKNPEKFEKWGSIVWWLVSRFWAGAEYLAIKSEIQGKINSFVRNLEDNTTAEFPRISIRWASKDEKEELIWEDGEAIIVMRDRQHRNKNFVHAAYFFTSEALLKKSKKHLSKSQKTSLDLFATKKILEAESSAAVEQFMNDYFSPQVEDADAVRQFIQKYLHIDRIGVFFPILIQELSNLGNKVFLTKPTLEVVNEVKSLVDFLEKFSEREVGDTTTPDSFIGKYTRCAIKIVASWQVRERGDVISQKNRVAYVAKRGFENIYIIGSDSMANKKFINNVSDAVLNDLNYVQQVRSYQFGGQIKMKGGHLKDVGSYLVYLHNPNAVKYLYEKKDIEELV